MDFIPRAVAKKKTINKRIIKKSVQLKADLSEEVVQIDDGKQKTTRDLQCPSCQNSQSSHDSVECSAQKQTSPCEDEEKAHSQSISNNVIADVVKHLPKPSAVKKTDKLGDREVHDNVKLSVGDSGHHVGSSGTPKLQSAKREEIRRLNESISSSLINLKGKEKWSDKVINHSTLNVNANSRKTTTDVFNKWDARAEDENSKDHSDACVSDRDDDEDDDEGPPVVSFSKNQRWPDSGEPVCVVCGKYGEYICNQTEADICSLECKAKNLLRKGLSAKASQSSVPLPEEEAKSLSTSAQTAATGGDTTTPYIYTEHHEIASLTIEQVQDIRNEVEIFVEGMNVQRPVLEFQQLCLPQQLQTNLDSSEYLTPTPIQMQAIPAALGLRDLMVCAHTSSGKTASFLIPAVITIYNQNIVAACCHMKIPYVLILAPTRELAMQIEEQAKQLMKGMVNMKTALLVGGLPLPPQLHRLQQGVQLLVGTPGRILEILRLKAVSMDEIRLVVIDEVDTLLQLGFQQQVYDIMVHLSDSHQIILTSATIPASIEKLATSLLSNPVFISVGTPSVPCASVKQVILWVEEPSKKKKLFAILQDPRHFSPPVIVFVDSTLGADLLAQAVEKSCSLSVASIHGDKPQNQRTDVLQRFKNRAFDVLVSTGVLGRGIDLPGVRMIINFDMPRTVEDYIHQIGRTGRLGSAGIAMTFLNNSSKKLFLQLSSTLKPLGVVLPPELVNSPHLHYQRQQHRSRHHHHHLRAFHSRRGDAMEGGSSRMVFGPSRHRERKRQKERESVTEVLKQRKRKFKP